MLCAGLADGPISGSVCMLRGRGGGPWESSGSLNKNSSSRTDSWRGLYCSNWPRAKSTPASPAKRMVSTSGSRALKSSCPETPTDKPPVPPDPPSSPDAPPSSPSASPGFPSRLGSPPRSQYGGTARDPSHCTGLREQADGPLRPAELQEASLWKVREGVLCWGELSFKQVLGRLDNSPGSKGVSRPAGLALALAPCSGITLLVTPCSAVAFLVPPCSGVTFAVTPGSGVVRACSGVTWAVTPCSGVTFEVTPCWGGALTVTAGSKADVGGSGPFGRAEVVSNRAGTAESPSWAS
eukprot:jgi/Botrbrau1/22124/Bobra.0206s0048.1